MALSTKDVKTGGEGGGLPKTIQPGNTSAEILEIRLDQPNFLKAEDGYFLILEMMTPKPTEDFVGFLLDKNNPNGGNYDGPVGRVKGSRWAFRDGKTKSGIEISRDKEIMKYIKNLCEALGGASMKWWDESDEKYNTIEDMIEAFNSDAPFKGVSLNCCICGREYYNNDGYINHDLYLPKFSKAGVPFEELDNPKSRLLVFNEADHIEKAEPREVEEFSGDEETAEDTSTDLTDVSGTDSPPAEFEL